MSPFAEEVVDHITGLLSNAAFAVRHAALQAMHPNCIAMARVMRVLAVSVQLWTSSTGSVENFSTS